MLRLFLTQWLISRVSTSWCASAPLEQRLARAGLCLTCAQRLLGLLPLDAGAEQIGETLHDGEGSFGEPALGRADHLQHPEAHVFALDERVDRAPNPVFGVRKRVSPSRWFETTGSPVWNA